MDSVLFTGIEKYFFKEVISTNLVARNLFKKGFLKEGSVVYADFQSEGKGQKNTEWYSEPEQNLLMSILYKPDFLSAGKYFFLNMVVTLGVYEALFEISSRPDIMIKWPNDIIIPDKGKLAGILIENTINENTILNTIIGIGVNVNQENYTPEYGNAISLRMLQNKIFDRYNLLNLICKYIEKYYLLLRSGKFDHIRKKYIGVLYAYNKTHYFEHTLTGKKFKAKIIDVDENGKIFLKDNKGNVFNYKFKEIAF